MHACKPMLVGMASPEFSEILLLFVCLQIWPNFPFETSTIVHGGWQKIELAQKNYASRSYCEMHANEFWWTWPLQLRRYRYFLNLAKFSSRTMGYKSMGVKKQNQLKKFMQVEVAVMHTNQFRWAWPLRFWRLAPLCMFQICWLTFLSEHELQSMG